MSYPPTTPTGPALCPACKKARLRETVSKERFTERICGAEHAPDIDYFVEVKDWHCPRCPHREKLTSDHLDARKKAVRDFWLKLVHGSGSGWDKRDIDKLRAIIRKVCENGLVEPEWFADWLINGG